MDQDRIKAAVTELLLAVGEDPEREGLLETPSRVAKMYAEIFSGLQENPADHLKLFQESQQQGELVLVRDIPMYSVCEHHLLPFVGKAHIAYIPKEGKIIGLSKFARIVKCFASRPQVQERLTAQIADFLFENLEPYGVAVLVEAEHLCMTMRGARAAGSVTQTSALRGIMKTEAKTRNEVMSLLTGRHYQ
ncbi:GTP cyclohydrolase I FolE [Clostridium minihomine]|uniref:GTP cyclohydrolase I FolE n=1 Tax=Clostridium minihomine TaxID=2045012 RepID=UPI000C758122|nr:GTP cyclohydrolase I FolE [Clostridium minihomine]